MGVIKRQSIKTNIVSLVGILVGALSTLTVYSWPETKPLYGLAQTILSFAKIAVPVLTIGAAAVAIRFYPEFQDESGRSRGLFSLLHLMLLPGILLFGLLFGYLGGEIQPLLSELGFRLRPFYENPGPIAALLLVIALGGIYDNYARNFYRTTIQTILVNLLPKVGLPLLLFLLFWHWVPTESFFAGLIAIYGLSAAGLLFYIYRLGGLDWQLRPWAWLRPKLRSIFAYAGYSTIGSIGSILAFQVDILMVGTLISLTGTAEYSIALFMTSVIEITGRSLNAISGPIVAQSWQRNDREAIWKIYRDVSITGGTIGTIAFVLVGVNIESIFNLTPSLAIMTAGPMVFLVLGAARVFELLTSINSHIIGYSRYYLFNLVATLALGLLNVALNYWLIAVLGFGIVGPAIATLCSLTLYNLLKLGFIWWVFGVQPFSRRTVTLLLVGGGIFAIGWLLPASGYVLLDLFYRTLLCGLLFLFALLKIDFAPEVSQLIREQLNYVRARFKR
jgi:O-antigen/teichoic acid export membrane protein